MEQLSLIKITDTFVPWPLNAIVVNKSDNLKIGDGIIDNSNNIQIIQDICNNKLTFKISVDSLFTDGSSNYLMKTNTENKGKTGYTIDDYDNVVIDNFQSRIII